MNTNYVVNNDLIQRISNPGFTELLKEVLLKGKPFRFQAAGYSMSPFIRSGDLITISPVSDPLRIGDIVAFINPCNNKLSVHRIISKVPNGYLLRGDNSPKEDGIVLLNEIFGRVIHIERNGRRVRLGLGSERIIIAFLSRYNWLIVLLSPFRRIKMLLKKAG